MVAAATAPAPVVFVAGLGRCGTSMAMQMLAAAGLPTAGSYPDFEVPEVAGRPLDATWLAAQAGRAVKWLDPHLAPAPRGISKVAIWLDRNPREQARSHAKLLELMAPPVFVAALGVDGGRRVRSILTARLASDTRTALASMRGTPVHRTSFEAIIRRPLVQARAIAGFLEPWFGRLDPEAMAGRVIPRPVTCAPGLDIEEAGIARARA